MSFDVSGAWRPEGASRLTWKDLAPTHPRDNPQYAMYKDVLDAIARLLGETAR